MLVSGPVNNQNYTCFWTLGALGSTTSLFNITGDAYPITTYLEIYGERKRVLALQLHRSKPPRPYSQA